MQIILVDKNQGMIDAWRKAFGMTVPIVHGSVFDVTASALVAPGNSSGSMTGGLDLEIAKADPGIEQRVRRHAPIEVGEAVIVSFDGPNYGWLVYTPTMPGARDVSDTDNAYTAMESALYHGSVFRSVVIPGLCTGVGRMDYEEAAKQMNSAWRAYNA